MTTPINLDPKQLRKAIANGWFIGTSKLRPGETRIIVFGGKTIRVKRWC